MLIIFLNGKLEEVDTVSGLVEEATHDMPIKNILLISHRWTNESVFSMGLTRSIPVELIKKILKKENLETNPLIVSNDADTVSFADDYLEHLLTNVNDSQFAGSISRFHFSGRNTLYDLNIVLGEIDRSIRGFNLEKRNPNSFQRGQMFPGGSNTAFKLSDFPGYNLSKDKGEDTDLCKRLTEGGVQFKYLNKSKVYTHPRRVINAFNNGRFFHEVWTDWFKDGSTGRELNDLESKDYSIEECIDFLNLYFSSRLKYLFNKNYHNHEIKNFARFTEDYVVKMLKYFKLFLSCGGFNLPSHTISNYPLQYAQNNEDVFKILENHKLIRLG